MSRRLDGGSTGAGSTEPAMSVGAGFAGAEAGYEQRRWLCRRRERT